MGNTILLGVLRMPPTIWRNDELDIYQRHVKYLQAADKIERMTEALDLIKQCNRLKNDRDAYQLELCLWGTGEVITKPDSADYGLSDD